MHATLGLWATQVLCTPACLRPQALGQQRVACPPAIAVHWFVLALEVAQHVSLEDAVSNDARGNWPGS